MTHLSLSADINWLDCRHRSIVIFVTKFSLQVKPDLIPADIALRFVTKIDFAMMQFARRLRQAMRLATYSNGNGQSRCTLPSSLPAQLS